MTFLTPRQATPRAFFAAAVVLAALTGCGGDGGDGDSPTSNTTSGTSNSTGNTTGGTSNTTTGATGGTSNTTTSTTGMTGTTGGTSNTTVQPKEFCEPCAADEECGGEADRCLQLPNETEPTCTLDCTEDEGACPDGTVCANVQEIPLVRQCVPEDFICDNMCGDVECGDGLTCDPNTGECIEPLGLCDLGCLTGTDAANNLCGGPEDLCLFLADTDEQFCSQSCDEESPCPEGYFCATVNQGDEEITQCVPDSLTCVERCSDVSCFNGEVCDPLTGECVEPLGQCDLDCVNNALCGDGPEDICLAIPDNAGDEAFCALGCDTEAIPSECPLNFFCAPLDGRESGVCVPIDLTCVDRCSDAGCPNGTNCDPQSGECIVSTLELCDPCGEDNSSSCGGQSDLCLGLGDPGGVICSRDCTDDQDSCPDGYTCAILNNTTRRACIPIGNDCLACETANCEEGTTCNPLTGECVGPPTSCLEEPCGEGEICNPDTEECELIGEACTFNTRIQDCFGPVRKCTATRSGSAGNCAVICVDNEDCTAEAPNCVDLYRVGQLCMPDGLGGPSTCGISAPDGVAIGRPCGTGVSSACDAGAPECIQGVEANVQGFCSRSCETDADCGGDGSCQELRGRDGRFCTPSNCLCLAGSEVPQGETDLLQLALDSVSLNRCSLTLDPLNQRLLNPETPGAPFTNSTLSGLVTQPLSSAFYGASLRQELSAAIAGSSPVRDAIITSAARQGFALEARVPEYAIPDQLPPLSEGLRRFVEAAGDTWSEGDVSGNVGDVPMELQMSLARILFAMADVLEARQGITDALGLDEVGVEALFANSPWLILPAPEGAQAPDLGEEAQLALLSDFDRAVLYQTAADLAATLAAVQLEASAEYSAVDIRLETSAGWIILGGEGDTTYEPSEITGAVALLLDVSGSDTYRIPAGANSSASQPVGLVIDLGGDDIYDYEAVEDPNDNDAWLPSDAGGRFDPVNPAVAGNGPVSLSAVGRQGSGRLGVGVLMDLGGGDDTYTSLRMSQGAGVLGVGVLYDDGGDDDYASEALSQGAAMLGIGLLLDAGASDALDSYRAWHAAQGFGAASGVGLLLDESGDTTYLAELATGLSDVLYFSPPDRGQSNLNLAQGAGAGMLPADSRFPERQALGGGLGVLFDVVGSDSYTAATFAQGAGRHLGAGFLIDEDGSDAYTARYGAMGAAELAAVGVLLDVAGDDRFNLEPDRAIGSLMGYGGDLAAGLLIDFGGDDAYRFPRASGGAGFFNGVGILMELGGGDTYTAVALSTLGAATLGVDDPDDPRRAVPTRGLFLDAGGDTDTYSRNDLEEQPEPFIDNDTSWTQRSDSELMTEQGIGIDGEGLTGFEPAP